MRKLLFVAGGVCILGLVLIAADNLRIRVAPSTLVLSSEGGKLTVHSNARYFQAEDVSLQIDGTPIAFYTFPDDRGFLVAQDAAAREIDPFPGKFTRVAVTLTVDGASATETIRVRK